MGKLVALLAWPFAAYTIRVVELLGDLPGAAIETGPISLLADPNLTPVTAVLLSDCGFGLLNPPEWIAKLQPQAVLLSVEAGDLLDRPSPETLEAVEGYSLLRTDRNGWIELSTDGERMWVEAAR